MKRNADKAIRGFIFNKYDEPEVSPFDKLFDIFKEIITHTSGDLDEALAWMKQLDEEYQLTNEDYTLDDFIEDLKKKGYIREEIDQDGNGSMAITAKTERAIRQQALEQIFGRLKKVHRGIIARIRLEEGMNTQGISDLINLVILSAGFP